MFTKKILAITIMLSHIAGTFVWDIKPERLPYKSLMSILM